MWTLSEEALRAEETRVFTETGGFAAGIKLSIIQLDSESAEDLGGKDASERRRKPRRKTLLIQAFN